MFLTDLLQLLFSVLAGGAGLQMKYYDAEEDENNNTYIMTATSSHLQKAADQFNLLKRTHEGQMKQFRIAERFDFENFEEDSLNFFSCSEQQFLVKCMLNHVICGDEEIKHIPGYPKIKIYTSRPVSKYLIV